MKRKFKAKMNSIATNLWIKFLEHFSVVVLFCREKEYRFKEVCKEHDIDPETARKVIAILAKFCLIIAVELISIGTPEWIDRTLDVLS